MTLSRLFAPVCLALGASLVGLAACSGSSPPPPTVPQVLAVVNDACRELVGPSDPEWVVLACQAEGVASGIANVKMRRTEWMARRGACRPIPDAGVPGL